MLGWRTCKSTYVGTLLYSLELPFFLHRNQYKFLSAIYNCFQQPMLGDNIGLYKIKSSHIKYDIPTKASKIYYFLEVYITHKQNLHISLFVYNCPLSPPKIEYISTPFLELPDPASGLYNQSKNNFICATCLFQIKLPNPA